MVKLLPGHSDGTGDAEMLGEIEVEEVVLEKELEGDAEVVASDVIGCEEINSLSVV